MAERYRLEILDHREVAPGHWEMLLPRVGGLRDAEPGQFVSVLCRTGESWDPLLRRPFSIYRAEEDAFSFLYRVAGRGTRQLSRARAGETLDLVGPLGRGFWYRDLVPGSRVALVGGGVGVLPLFFLSQRLLEAGAVPEIYAGFASARQAVALDRWQRLGLAPQVATDDGTLGYRGVVTELLERRLAGEGLQRIYACGPRPMLREVARLAGAWGIPCQVAMEEWMACGAGVCLSCVIKVEDDASPGGRWMRVCREGPVFDGAKVVWNRA